MITNLYQGLAQYYEVIADDRDFNQEVELLFSRLNVEVGSQLNLLELFAGPAYHSIEALKKSNVRAWAIDSSTEMKEIGIQRGFSDTQCYLVGTIPEVMDKLPSSESMDCILCMRYSIGYLDRAQVYSLLEKIRNALRPGGKAFIEVHIVSNIIANMQGTKIHHREAESACGEKVLCAWPSEAVQWAKEDYEANMNVSLRLEDGAKRQENYSFLSKEIIYSAREIIFLASLRGLDGKILANSEQQLNSWNTIFENSIIIELSK